MTSSNYKLNDDFIKKYSKKDPGFGFNGLGKLVYLRTYSRIKPDGNNEEWFETIRRVVEGIYTIQKRHILKYNLGWSEDKAHESAEEMYDRMFTMKFLPPGRGLWACGTDLINVKGLFAALNNCAFVSTENLDVDLAKPFEFMMDMSMLGVGVGFDTKGEGKLTILKPLEGDFIYEIGDTREEWVKSLRMLLNAFFKGDLLPKFDYSSIRKEGEIIKTFGGKSAGSAPLILLHNDITNLLTDKIGKQITSTDIVDIMNYIGRCVVSGNVRRTAQIAFGKPDDDEYLKLKDYHYEEGIYKGSSAHRSSYGWCSNNSVLCDLGMDYSNLASQTVLNGEPGYFWLDNARAYSRMNNGPDWKDTKVKGCNPCGEQSLESYEMCCLVETFPTRHETKEDFLRTLKFAYLYAKSVTLGNTHWVETNRVMLRNRRIGTSLSGIAQFVDTKGVKELTEWLNKGYDVIQHYDQIYSDWLAIPKSIKTTSIKPSGTVSLLPGVTPGMHYPESNYYIRRVRLAKNSDLLGKCRKANYKIEESVSENNSYVVEIPVEITGVRTISQVSMWEQLMLAALLQRYWSDNQVSCTITFKPEEAKDIAHALNYFQYQLKAVSFLPKTELGSYAQMPYEEITKDAYLELSKNIKPLELSNIQEDSKPELYCDSDSCSIL